MSRRVNNCNLCECSSEVICASVIVKSGLEIEITAVGDPPH
jgi:hypothetical protein